ncbi:MAG: hypothetical protein KGI54_14930 [Pseudomonadota bacterium]|nr:hypothetical protein [Pseudomonadota bacterium]
MTVIIPLSNVASQTLSVALDGQSCQIKVYQKTTGLFLDLSLNNAPILSGQICRDRVKIIRESYLGIQGDFAFFDTQGLSDPVYDPTYAALGTRFKLVFFSASEL